MFQYWRACGRSSCSLAHTLPPKCVLNLSVAVRYLYNAGNVRQRWVVLSGGILGTPSLLAAGLRDAGACGLYDTGGWQPAWLALFRKARRVCVALD